MWLKFVLGVLFALSLLAAFVLAPLPQGLPAKENNHEKQHGRHLRIMTWNLGNGDLEADSRAHTEDLPEAAKVISEKTPDAVALQELTGEDQLNQLLKLLRDDYRGFVCSSGGADRVDAVLIKNNVGSPKTQFEDIKADDHFAAGARFRLSSTSPQIVIVSAHADAFSAVRRRVFNERLVDWVRTQLDGNVVFVAGDFNLEVSTRNKSSLFTDDEKHDSESYASLLKFFRDLGRDAGATAANDRRIDYVFGDSEGVALIRAEVLRDAAIGRMDHWPLLVEVTF